MQVNGIDTVILCGGKGTRLRELTESLPKPLVEVGDRPILWHIMQNYAAQGFPRFALALGHLGYQISGYFAAHSDGWTVQYADTGGDANTGSRIKQMEHLISSEIFFATYGDGLADIDFAELLAFHRTHGRIATVTAVRPRNNFGVLQIDSTDHVERFDEKPLLESWINGGFFVFDRRIFGYLDDRSALEEEPMRALASDRQLIAYKHTGFWQCMDTYKDHAELNRLWNTGEIPWRTVGVRP
jgi:glucose-1-phosphate cytidylyltransferase